MVKDHVYLNNIRRSLGKIGITSDKDWSQKSQGIKWMYVSKGFRDPDTPFVRFRVYKHSDWWKEGIIYEGLPGASTIYRLVHVKIPEWDVEVRFPTDIEEDERVEKAISIVLPRLRNVIQ